MTALFGYLLWRRRRTVLAWAIGLVAMAAAVLGFYPSVRETAEEIQRMIDSAPGLMAAFGVNAQIDFASPGGYLSGRLFGFVVPLCLIIVAVGVGAGITAGDEEDGRLEVLLAHPLRRSTWAVLGFALLTAVLVAVSVALFLAILLLRQPTGVTVGWVEVAALTAADAGVSWVFGALALAIGAGTGRRGLALGGAVSAAVATYLIDSLAPVAPVLDPWRWASPFWWAGGREPVLTGFASPWMLLLPAFAATLAAVAAAAIDRRDLRTAS